MSALGDALRAARTERGKTLDVTAAEIGVDRATIYRWEHGLREPRGLARRALEAWLAKGDAR